MTADEIQAAVECLEKYLPSMPLSNTLKGHVQTLLVAYAEVCRERGRLREACRLIMSGWGHQDGVSRAVEAARAALGEK